MPTASPFAVDGMLYVGGGQTFSASPIAVGKRVMLLTEEGLTFVLDTGRVQGDREERSWRNVPGLARGCGNAIYIRTETKLYKIGS